MWEEILGEELPLALESMREAERLEMLGLLRPLRALPTRQPAGGLAPSATVREASDTLKRAHLSCVLVVEHDHLVGVFTERDVLTTAAAQEIDVDRTPVGACMTPNPEWLELDDELVYALHRMRGDGYRHTPVVDAQGRPTALVSMQAIVAYLVVRFPQEILHLPPSLAHSRRALRKGREEHSEGRREMFLTLEVRALALA